MNFYYNSVCHVCKQVVANLKRCSSCKCIAYCSKNHQIADWGNHKQICKVLSEFKKCTKLKKYSSYDEWRSYRIHLQFYLEHRMKRELLPYESQMWMFPRNCVVCYSTEDLKDCPACFCVAYCSNEHEHIDKTTHVKFCDQLKLCLDYDIFYLNKPDLELKLKEVTTDITSLPKNISKCISLFLDITHLSRVEEIFVTDIYATIITIIYGLEKCKILDNRCTSLRTLVIHLVGADISEFSLNWSYYTSLLQSWIKNLILCKFILIGPDNALSLKNEIVFDNIQIHYVNGYYHDVVDKIDIPNIIIALNSGLHEFESTQCDTWNKSLPKLINKNAPLLLTAYTEEELQKDLKRLLVPLDIVNIERNPFSNLKPNRDWDSRGNALFYVNAYLAIVDTCNIV